MKIKYVAMPITFEQKREFNAQGFQVVDAKFAPDGEAIESLADGVERTVTLKGKKPARKKNADN